MQNSVYSQTCTRLHRRPLITAGTCHLRRGGAGVARAKKARTVSPVLRCREAVGRRACVPPSCGFRRRRLPAPTRATATARRGHATGGGSWWLKSRQGRSGTGELHPRWAASVPGARDPVRLVAPFKAYCRTSWRRGAAAGAGKRTVVAQLSAPSLLQVPLTAAPALTSSQPLPCGLYFVLSLTFRVTSPPLAG